MMWKWLVTALRTITEPVFSLLPTVSLPVAVTDQSEYARQAGRTLAYFNGTVPVVEALTFGKYVVGILGALVIYRVANWIWRHLAIPGTGMGGG